MADNNTPSNSTTSSSETQSSYGELNPNSGSTSKQRVSLLDNIGVPFPLANTKGRIYVTSDPYVCRPPPPPIPPGTPVMTAIDTEREAREALERRMFVAHLEAAKAGPLGGSAALGAEMAGAPVETVENLQTIGENLVSAGGLRTGSSRGSWIEPMITPPGRGFSAPPRVENFGRSGLSARTETGTPTYSKSGSSFQSPSTPIKSINYVPPKNTGVYVLQRLPSLDWKAVVPKYGQYKGQNRVDHVREHNTNSAIKNLHGVFNGDGVQITNEAWQKADQLGLSPNARGVLIVPMGRVIGIQGGTLGSGADLTNVLIVVVPGTGKIISAYPF